MKIFLFIIGFLVFAETVHFFDLYSLMDECWLMFLAGYNAFQHWDDFDGIILPDMLTAEMIW